MATKSTKSTMSTDEVVVDEEKELLKKQVADMQAQNKQMMNQINMLMQMMNGSNSEKKVNRPIKFISLVPGKLVLQGSRTYYIEEQFGSQTFSESEASVIISASAGCINAGYVWIDDEQFVEEHNLLDVYGGILSADTLKQLFNKSCDDIVALYKSASDEQKGIVVDMISKRCENGDPVDANVLKKIGKLSGRDLINIEVDEDE